MPTIKVKHSFKVKKEPAAPYPTAPVLIGYTATFTLTGTATDGDKRSSLTLEPGKSEVGAESKLGENSFGFKASREGNEANLSLQFNSEAETSLGKVKFSGELDVTSPGDSNIGIEFGDVDFKFGLTANADLTKLFQFTAKTPPIDTKSLALGQWAFSGKIEPKIDVSIGPNPVWSGWSSIGSSAARAVSTTASYVRGVFIAGEAGTVTTFGVVAAAASVAAVYVTWVGFGLYMIGKAGQEGRALACQYSFANGYADMLARLTDDRPALHSEDEFWKLHDLDWRSVVSSATEMYVNHGTDALGELPLLDRAGQAAILQDAMKIVTSESREGWKLVQEAQRAKYGARIMEREQKYRSVLYAQVKGGGQVGIRLV